MNRTEAITILEGFKDNPLFNSTHAQAFDMAISVLSENKSEWIMRGGRIRCKKCDSLAPIITDWEDGCTIYKYTRTQYCPNCGAKMKGGE